jgi:D-alanine-D-alanine ligase
MRVLILLGGDSAERDVSWSSGVAVARALASRHHDVTGLDPATGEYFHGSWYGRETEIARTPPHPAGASAAPSRLVESLSDPQLSTYDVVFIALHGGSGEDGTVQSLLGLAGAAYTGSGPLASGVAMHKDTTKRLLVQAGVPTPDWIYPHRPDDDAIARLGLPLIVKPVAEGSTVGLTLVKEVGQFEAALAKAGDPLLERFIPGRELSVPILDGRALPPVEIVPQHEIYDYECKYTDGMSEYHCPAPLSPDITSLVCDLAGRAFAALGCQDYARIDFRLTSDGTPYCLEANTLPGMTSHSLVPQAARAIGLDLPALCETICRLATARHGRPRSD